MNKKIWILLTVLSLLFTLTACNSSNDPQDDNNQNEEDDEPTPTVLEINQVNGLDDETIIQGEYFNPLKGVEILNQDQELINEYIHVSGFVDYGNVGSYELDYRIEYGEDTYETTRMISVIEGTITKTPIDDNQLLESINFLGDGSYRAVSDSSIDHPINPNYISNDLLMKPVPSNGWWTSLLVQNYGGGNGIYTNPFRTSFSNLGMEVTSNGEGFIQYWAPDGYNTMANYSLALPDFHIKSSDLNHDYVTEVIDYSDAQVSVAMRNNNDLTDHLVMTLTQGSPFVFVESASKESPYITLASNGVNNYEYFNLDGNLINSNTHTGSGVIIKLIGKHIGYQTSRPANVGQPTYGDRYYLISTPAETTFTFSSKNHPFGLNNHIDIDLESGNYFSVASINAISEASYFHERAMHKPLNSHVSYHVDYDESMVQTTYQTAYQTLDKRSDSSLIQWLMPHHYQNSMASLSDYTMPSVRGTLKLLEGNRFDTELSFHGVIPAMTKPVDSSFNEATMVSYLEDLSLRTQIDDTENFLNDEGPYWNSKALYPLAQAIIIADQLNEEVLKETFIEKLGYLLKDWYTYTDSSDERYLFYNDAWGSVYYSNNDFNTATELSDHSFTHGYLIYASSVLAMYDPSFSEDYEGMVDLLLHDYMHPTKDSDTFAYLRNFDPWAGHTWAHGFGTFAEGNNMESSSEAINSWVGGYLWALKTNDQALMDAAIYGFVHEVSHAKTYMFDYSETIFPDNYSAYAKVAGMIWGGKYDYATWFGANPTFIYGIQWLPNGEYLSSYALNDEEYSRLETVYEAYLASKSNTIDTWYANMWSIQALLDPSVAVNQFDADKILNDDYPSDLSQTYYLIHSLNTYGRRTTEYTMQVHERVASSIYIDDDGVIHAMIWNASSETEEIIFNTPEGEISIEVTAQSFTTVSLND